MFECRYNYSSCGASKMVESDWVKPGAVVIDVGIIESKILIVIEVGISW